MQVVVSSIGNEKTSMHNNKMLVCQGEGVSRISPEILKELALNLEREIEANISSNSVKALSISLAQTIEKAKQGKIKNTVARIDGSAVFTHGALRELSELENAYAKFKLYITLGV